VKVRYIILTALIFSFFCCFIASAANINVTYNINTTANKTPISKYVYGSNFGGGTDYTIRRSGGNRLTAYNWENNWSNAGSDWNYSNDQYMSSSPIPGKAITDFVDQCVSQGQDSIVTLQMADYVSAPFYKEINLATEAAPSMYFYPVVPWKGDLPFCDPPGSPDTSDGVVYMDEFVNFLVWKYGYSGSGNGVKFYNLDNEPDLWSDGNRGATHPEVHHAKPTCLEIKDKGSVMSYAVKLVDPNAQILGPVSYGFAGYLDFQGASDWQSVKGSRPWFISYYLDEMRYMSNSVAGIRLLDVLDVHWYPEAQDGAGHRILQSINTQEMYNARMQAPRTLWDDDYVYPHMTYPDGEVSWLNDGWTAQYLPLIPRLKADIAQYYPDTNLAITEYAYGPETHWSTGIATADFLGICGKYGVYITNYWGNGSYVDAAIKIYRNYDGAHSKFGDMNVVASMSNKVDSSIYASVFNGYTCEMHLIVINKNQSNAISGTFNITSPQTFNSGRVWKFDNTSSNISETTAISSITNNQFVYTIPARTVCHMVLYANPPDWDDNSDCHVNILELDAFADDWLNTRNFSHFSEFAQEWGM